MLIPGSPSRSEQHELAAAVCISGSTVLHGGGGRLSWPGHTHMPHRRRLRSASTDKLDVPTCRRSTIGGRAFPVAGAKVWNGLPSEVTSASSLSVFKNRLKTYLFRRCYETV